MKTTILILLYWTLISHWKIMFPSNPISMEIFLPYFTYYKLYIDDFHV